MITVGVDVGSKNIKVTILADGEIVAQTIGTGGFEQDEVARKLLGQAVAAAGLGRNRVAHLTATGAGRDTLGFVDSSVTDIAAAARGANFFFPGVTTIIEVGAEESRSIKTDGEGKVVDAAVNEKCAAGSGSFTESMARALGMTLKEFAEKCEIRAEPKFDAEADKTVGLMQLILQERSRPRCDVFWSNEILTTLRLQQEGLLDVYRPKIAEEYPEAYRSPQGTWHGFAGRARVLVINTELVPDESEWPRSIRDLAAPKWRGRAAIANMLRVSKAFITS